MAFLPPPAQALSYYRSLGFTMVPLKPHTKEAYVREWQTKSADELLQAFKTGDNAGLRTEGGLTDVDLDCKEARQLAPLFLPATPMKHGRGKARGSHYWYRAEGMTNHVYRDPITNEKLIEVHADRRQTMVWPSVHPVTGETIEWEGPLEPCGVENQLLGHELGRLAAAVVLARSWPTGNRHDLALCLGGALLRNGWDVESAVGFVGAAAQCAGDDDLPNREQAVRDTGVAYHAGRHTTGIPTLKRILDGRIVDAICEWLDLNDHTEAEVEVDDYVNPVPYIMPFGVFITFPFPEPVWLIDRFIHVGDIGLTQGPPKSQKSWLELYMHMCIATGRTAFGKFVTGEPLRTIYVQDDQSGGQMQANVRRMAIGMGFDLDLLNANMFFVVQQGVRIDSRENMQTLTAAIAEHKPGFLSFDTFRSAHALNENESDDMQEVMDVVKKLRNRQQITVSLVHHTTKNTSATDVGNLTRGSSAIWGAADNLIAIQKEELDGKKFGRVTFDGRGFGWAEPFKFSVEEVGPDVRLVYYEVTAAERKQSHVELTSDKCFEAVRQGTPYSTIDEIMGRLAEMGGPRDKATVERYLNMLKDQNRITRTQMKYKNTILYARHGEPPPPQDWTPTWNVNF